MSTLIRAIRIKLYKTYAAVPDMGLYTENGVSQLRYAESPLSGVSTAYSNGILIEIGDIECNADFRKGGASVQVSDIIIKLAGTIMLNGSQRQFCYALDMAEISLIGLILEIIEFEGTKEDSDSVEVLTMFTGSIENISWNETEFIITVKSSLSLKRNACMTTVNSSGITTPITFGSSDPASGRYFKAVRTVNVEKTLTLKDLSKGGTVYPETMDQFPILNAGASPTLNYLVQLGQMDSTAYPDGSAFEGKYIKIIRGKGGQGTLRKIRNCTKVSVGGVANAVLQFDIYDYLNEDMIGNSTGDHKTGGTVDQTWIQFIDIQMEHELDSLPCDGFYDYNSVKINNAAELYALNGEAVYRIPGYGYDVDQDNVDRNSLIIDPKLFENSPFELSSFLILPITSIKAADTNLSEYAKASNWFKLANGHFYVGQSSPDLKELIEHSITGSGSNVMDKAISTYQTYYSFFWWEAPASRSWLHISFIKMPQVPSGYKFTSAYLLVCIDKKAIKSLNQSDPIEDATEYTAPWYLHAVKRGYIDRVENLFDSGKSEAIYGNYDDEEGSFDNIPDFYTLTNRNLKNVKFYVNREKDGSDQTINVGNYETIDLKVNNIQDYNAIEEMMVGCERNLQFQPYRQNVRDYTRIHEICVALKSTASIKSEVYL